MSYYHAGSGRFLFADRVGELIRAVPLEMCKGALGCLGGRQELANGVDYLQRADGNVFGYYSFLVDQHYLFHQDLDYEYVFDADDGANGMYLYDFASQSFFYTSPNFGFPYLYDFSLDTVLYYYPDPNNPGWYNTNGVCCFYNFATGEIITK